MARALFKLAIGLTELQDFAPAVQKAAQELLNVAVFRTHACRLLHDGTWDSYQEISAQSSRKASEKADPQFTPWSREDLHCPICT